MNAIDPLRAAVLFGFLFAIPLPVFVGLVTLAVAIFAVLGSLGLTASSGFPLWLTLPLLFLGPVMYFIGAGFVAAPFFVLIAGSFYLGAIALIRLNAPLFCLLVLGVCSGLLAGVIVLLISDARRLPWSALWIGAVYGLIASAVLMVVQKYFPSSIVAKTGVDDLYR